MEDNRNRLILVSKVIEWGKEHAEYQKELMKYPFDFEGIEITLSDEVILSILNRYLLGEVSESEVEDWANFIECRDDIDYSKNEELIFNLANPILNGAITKSRVKNIIANFK